MDKFVIVCFYLSEIVLYSMFSYFAFKSLEKKYLWLAIVFVVAIFAYDGKPELKIILDYLAKK